jgi:hypothetical protein
MIKITIAFAALIVGGYYFGAKEGAEERIADLTLSANSAGKSADRAINDIGAQRQALVGSVKTQVTYMMKNPP